MASYLEWNEAIAEYFAYGLTPGDTYYLSVDEDALIEIATYHFGEGRLPDAVRDFGMAVQEECVADGRVTLPKTTPQRQHGPPACLAFLGTMVLAAHRMAPEDDIAEINYFTRLREILGMVGDRGRPPGLSAPGAPEERLWLALNTWILHSGWQPSADRGPDGPLKFTNYPLSQSLLRTGDKEKLKRDFANAESDLGRDSDRERVSAWFFNRATDFSTHHIRKLAREATTDRYEAIADAVYNVYASIDWNRPVPDGGTPDGWRSPHRLMAGLYREFDPIFGTTTYCLFPRRQHKELRTGLSVVRNGKPEPLCREQDGQFRPMWPVHPDGGETYKVTGDPRITDLYLPTRRFWVLTRDRYDDASGTFASRGAPRLGETFLLLCREECQEQLHILKDEGLLDWEDDPVDVSGYRGWTEYRECMALSASWDGIIPQIPELFDELRPRTRASISLQGGLKTGRQDTWLEGYLPHLLITSFDPTWRVSVTNVSRPDVEPALDDTVSANAVIELPCLAAGDHLLEVGSGGGRPTDRRYIRVLSWDALQPTEPRTTFGTPVGDYILHGAVLAVRPDTVVDEEV